MPTSARLRLVVALMGLALRPITSAASADTQSPRTVVVVHSGAEDFPSNPILDAAIREALASPPHVPYDYFAEYLEADRFEARDASRALGQYMRRKYQGRRIDIVIALTNTSLQFVWDHRADLFPGTPVVFMSASVRGEPRGAKRDLTGVTVDIAYPETLKLALELHPSTEQVFVIASSRNAQTVEAVRAGLNGFATRVKLTYMNEDTLPGLLAAVRAVPPRSLILYVWYSLDAPGSTMYPDEVVRLVADAARVPVYGMSDLYLGSGIVGGVMRSDRETGTRLGQIARQILNGAKPADIPIETARVAPTFDWRQLRRLGIDPSALPPGSDIRFRVPSTWELYGPYAVTFLIVIVAQLVLIVGLLTQQTRRRHAEQTVRSSEATLRASYEQIRQLAGRLINVQEETRAHVARDLHDGVCQELVGVSIAVSSLKRSSSHIQDPQTQDELSSLEHRAFSVVEGVRRLSHDLHPAALRLLGLAAALKTHCIEVERRHDVQVSFTAWGDLPALHPDTAVCLFRIAQEALRNGAVHGNARRLRVSLARDSGHVDLTVADDGRGFDLAAVRRASSGLGLVSMKERAHAVGGEVYIATRLGLGTTIRVRVPLCICAAAERGDVRVEVHTVADGAPESRREPS